MNWNIVRSKDNSAAPLEDEVGENDCERGEMAPMLIPCSRNAHDQNVLVRRPQWDQHGCHCKKKENAPKSPRLLFYFEGRLGVS
jgi:hypothetical protein